MDQKTLDLKTPTLKPTSPNSGLDLLRSTWMLLPRYLVRL